MKKPRSLAKRLLPPAAIAALAGILWLIVAKMKPSWGEATLETGSIAVGAAAIGVFLIRTLDFAVFDIFFVRSKGREAPDLLRGLVAVIGYSALAAFLYGVVLDRNLAGFLATSAVVSVILGLALQDTLGNFFAGISIHIEEPYQIGDTIQLGGLGGRVQSVTWRTTALMTNNNSVIVLPNSMIAREPIEIYRLNESNRRIMQFNGPYHVAPERIIGAVTGSLKTLEGLASSPVPHVRVAGFGSSEMIYEALYWVTDYMEAPDMDARIRERIWYLFLRNGWEIPFPVRHVVLERRHAPVAASHPELASILETIDLFHPLSPPERLRLAGSMQRRLYGPGEYVVTRGAEGSSMFIISEGRAHVLVPGPGGQPQRVATLEPGGFFGEMALFTGEPRAADVCAASELAVLEIRKQGIEALLRENGELAEAFSQVFAQRQAGLAEMSRPAAEAQSRENRATILRRIQRFFRLV